MSAGRSPVARALLAASLIATSVSACDEPNEPNAIQPADFARSGAVDDLLPGEDAPREPASTAAQSTTDDVPAIDR